MVQIGSKEVCHVHNWSSRVTIYLVDRDYERVAREYSTEIVEEQQFGNNNLEIANHTVKVIL